MRPKLDYAATVWSSGQKLLLSVIEKIQSRAARYVSGNFKRTDSVIAMVDDLKWDSLEERWKKNRATMLQKIRTGLAAIPPTKLILATKQTIEHEHKLLHISTRTNYHKFSFYPSAIKFWNLLPSKLVHMANRTIL